MCGRTKKTWICGKYDYAYPKCDLAKTRKISAAKCPNYRPVTVYEGHIDLPCSLRCGQAYKYGWKCHMCQCNWGQTWLCGGVHQTRQAHGVCECDKCIVNTSEEDNDQGEEAGEESENRDED